MWLGSDDRWSDTAACLKAGVRCRRNGGDKDDSKAGMNSRVHGITWNLLMGRH